MPIVFIKGFCVQALVSFYLELEFNAQQEMTFIEYKISVVKEILNYMSYVLFVYLFSPSMLFTSLIYFPIFIVGKILLDV